VGAGAATGIGLGVAALYAGIVAANKGMEIYEQRAKGVIAVGSLLGQNFDQVGQSIEMLRHDYQILNTESPQTMQALARITGRIDEPTLRGIGVYSRAYGVSSVEASRDTGLLQRITTGAGVNPLALAGRLATPQGVGFTPMPLSEQTKEVLRIAQMGSQGGGRVPLAYFSRLTAMLGGLGEEMQVPGAASELAGRLMQGQDRAPSEAVYGLRVQALENYRRQHGNRFVHAGQVFDLSDPYDKDTLLERAGRIPELAAEFFKTGINLGGGPNAPLGLQAEGIRQVYGGENISRFDARRMVTDPTYRAKVEALGRPPTAEEEAQTVADLKARQDTLKARPEYAPEVIKARVEEMLEPAGAAIVNATTTIEKKLLDLKDSMLSTCGAVDQVTGGFKDLQTILTPLITLLGRLPTASTADEILNNLAGPLNVRVPGTDLSQLPFTDPWELMTRLLRAAGQGLQALPTTPQKPAR
jgi:hypothetical protein